MAAIAHRQLGHPRVTWFRLLERWAIDCLEGYSWYIVENRNPNLVWESLDWGPS